MLSVDQLALNAINKGCMTLPLMEAFRSHAVYQCDVRISAVKKPCTCLGDICTDTFDNPVFGSGYFFREPCKDIRGRPGA